MKRGDEEVTRRTGSKKIAVPCPNDIAMHQGNMGGIDSWDLHRIVGAGFTNVLHFKNGARRSS